MMINFAHYIYTNKNYKVMCADILPLSENEDFAKIKRFYSD